MNLKLILLISNKMTYRSEIVNYIAALSEILWIILTFHKYTFKNVLTYFIVIAHLWMVMYVPINYFNITNELIYTYITTFLCSYIGKGLVINRYLYCLNRSEKCAIISLVLTLDMFKYFK